MKYLVLLVNTFFVISMAHPQQRHQQQQQHHQQQHQAQQINNNQNHNEPDSKYKHIQIVSLQNNLEHDGSFNYAYEGDDGTKQQQNGQLKQSNFDSANVGEAVQGGFSYQGDDGQTYELSYVADEFGYRPTGSHLPTPPPIPPEIARAVEYLKSLPSTTDAPRKRL